MFWVTPSIDFPARVTKGLEPMEFKNWFTEATFSGVTSPVKRTSAGNCLFAVTVKSL